MEKQTKTPFPDVVTTEPELREMLGTPSSRAVLKVQPALDAHARALIALSPFVLIATSDGRGACDVSPKGDRAGFVHVVDERRLVVPDRPGNKRLDGMRNLLENPHVGLLFLVPGRDETLRINGRAWVIRNRELLDQCEVHGKRPLLGIGIEVEECFMHCARAFLRSRLWSSSEWPAPDALPAMARMLFDQINPEGITLDEYEREIGESYSKLY